jgi:hypothetical protein
MMIRQKRLAKLEASIQENRLEEALSKEKKNPLEPFIHQSSPKTLSSSSSPQKLKNEEEASPTSLVPTRKEEEIVSCYYGYRRQITVL